MCHAECRHAPGVMEYSPTAIVGSTVSGCAQRGLHAGFFGSKVELLFLAVSSSRSPYWHSRFYSIPERTECIPKMPNLTTALDLGEKAIR